MERAKYPFPVKFTVMLLGIILFFYAIILARDYLYPIVLGMLLSYLLYPLANWLESKHVPRILANFISIIIGVVVLASAMTFIYKQVSILLENLPEIKQQAAYNINNIVGSVNDYLGLDDKELKTILAERITHLFDSSSNFLNEVFSATTGTLVKIGLLPVYVFLFLYYRTKIAVFVLKIVSDEKKFTTVKILREIADVTKRYMIGVFTVVAILCVLNSVGLYIVGLKYALILGIISALFNFIPYFGTILGGSIPFLFAFLTEPSPVYALRVIILFIIIQFIENNILTPNISGGAVKINPMVTIMSVIAAALIWGLPGMFAIIPLMGMLKIILQHFDDTRPYAFLLGTEGTSSHAINLTNISGFFKKIRSK